MACAVAVAELCAIWQAMRSIRQVDWGSGKLGKDTPGHYMAKRLAVEGVERYAARSGRAKPCSVLLRICHQCGTRTGVERAIPTRRPISSPTRPEDSEEDGVSPPASPMAAFPSLVTAETPQ